MKILLTGGDGYIGSRLALVLKEKGHEVEIFDKPKDICNYRELSYAVQGKDIVYHLAAIAEIAYTDTHPDETYKVNIEGANIVAKICAEQGVLLNFISTSCIYGNPLEVPSREDRLINPSDTYAMSKAAGEYIVKMWGLSAGLRFNILRLGTVYGPSTHPAMRGDMCIQKFLEAAILGQEISITGDGGQNRNFINIYDLVDGLALLAEGWVEGQTINFVGKESISINDIAKYALSFGATKKNYTSERKDDFYNQNVSTEKAKNLLGWEPKINFETGIREFYSWLKDRIYDNRSTK